MAPARLDIRVTPRANTDEVAVDADGSVRVRVHAPPVDGEANAAVIKVLAEALNVPRSGLCIAAGAIGRNKVVEVEGLTAEEVLTRLRRSTANDNRRRSRRQSKP